MACSSCATKDGQPKGCKNNGTCGTDGCNKLTVFDWLSNMSLPNGAKPFDFVEVRFKNGRKVYFQNTENLTLSIGDVVATQANSGHDVGMISLAGELVRVQMKRKKIPTSGDEILKIYRKATQKDIDIWKAARDREEKMKVRAREIAIKLDLKMKISDIEFQGDASKATFYYTAEERVDFRQLIKDFAKEFSIRIEMRQIGFRQEAARLGGIGSCGRELCCSTWLTDFRSVNTSAARYQQLSLNPQKLAGQCGKLKCCLNYELDGYLEALNTFPKTDVKIKTEKGTAVCQKIDIFKGYLWYAYEGEWMNWFTVKAEDANEMIRMNQQKETVEALEDYAIEDKKESTFEYENVVGQDSLTRFDQPKKSGNRRRNNRKKPQNQQRKQQRPEARKAGHQKKEGDVGVEQKKTTSRRKPGNRSTNKPNNNRPNNKTNQSTKSTARTTDAKNTAGSTNKGKVDGQVKTNNKPRPKRKPKQNNKQNPRQAQKPKSGTNQKPNSTTKNV
ncbi:PSP1 domain-containing protein [Aquimarina agarilytica]|uniref:PSP1 domain-containing protein n=1 Tax=Aquimarina agarilytica TaxID=1087449 RepID=UPI0002891DBA|nr:regulatory iron-sulfur-containing complex subunit RicT [Aquimarina agarilytica]